MLLLPVISKLVCRMSVAAPVQAQPAMGVAAGGAARRARQPGAWPPGSQFARARRRGRGHRERSSPERGLAWAWPPEARLAEASPARGAAAVVAVRQGAAPGERLVGVPPTRGAARRGMVFWGAGTGTEDRPSTIELGHRPSAVNYTNDRFYPRTAERTRAWLQ